MSESTTRILHGDAFKELAELPDDHAHAAVVDYPWQFEIQNGTGRFEYRNREGRGLDEGCRDVDHDEAMFDMAPDEKFSELLDELARVLVDGAWLICMADDRFQEIVRESMREDEEWIFRRNWAWTPQNMGMGYYGRVDHYPMPVGTVGETERYVQDRSTLFTVENGRDVDYPTGKPVDLYRQLLASPVVEEGERLLEPFCGSGPGAAVARERGLSYWGCDVDVDAVEMAEERFEQSSINTWEQETIA